MSNHGMITVLSAQPVEGVKQQQPQSVLAQSVEEQQQPQLIGGGQPVVSMFQQQGFNVQVSAQQQQVTAQTIGQGHSAQHSPQLEEDSRDGEDEEEEEELKRQCKECDKEFTSKKEFLKHMYNHKENPKYICPICSKIFPSEPGFKRHVRAHQNRQRRNISCSICQSVFTTRCDLEEHHREKHLDHKMFGCEMCGTQFSWQDNLNKHMKMHYNNSLDSRGSSKTDSSDTEAFNYKCDICNASFMDKISLRIHSRSHSAEAKREKKAYQCKVCSKEFKFDFSYIAHMNAHEKTQPAAKPADSSKKARIQLVTEYGEEAPSDSTGNKGLSDIQLAPFSSPSSSSNTGGSGAQSVYGTPSSDDIKHSVSEDDVKYTVIDSRKFVKSPFKGGRRSDGLPRTSPSPSATTKRRGPQRGTPALYDLQMTDEKPHQCEFCSAKFRWEVSLTIHKRDHDPDYRPPEKAQRGRPRVMDPGPDYTYRIVRRRDSDEEDDEEFEDIKGEPGDPNMRPKRRYRKKKDLERANTAFGGGIIKTPEDQVTTVVKLTRTADIQPEMQQQIQNPIPQPITIVSQSQHIQIQPHHIQQVQQMQQQHMEQQQQMQQQHMQQQQQQQQRNGNIAVQYVTSSTPMLISSSGGGGNNTVQYVTTNTPMISSQGGNTVQYVSSTMPTISSITPVVSLPAMTSNGNIVTVLGPASSVHQTQVAGPAAGVIVQQGAGGEPIYAVNHQGIHFQMLSPEEQAQEDAAMEG